jgi:hypothetical protein
MGHSNFLLALGFNNMTIKHGILFISMVAILWGCDSRSVAVTTKDGLITVSAEYNESGPVINRKGTYKIVVKECTWWFGDVSDAVSVDTGNPDITLRGWIDLNTKRRIVELHLYEFDLVHKTKRPVVVNGKFDY